MKKSMGIIKYFIVAFIIFLAFQDKTYAATFAGGNENDIPQAFQKYEYCVYQPNNIYNFASYKMEDNDLYSNVKYIFIHDEAEGKIRFLTPNEGAILLDNSNVTIYKWLDKWFSKKFIDFDKNLYDFLIDENGKMNCDNLFFYVITDNSTLMIDSEKNWQDKINSLSMPQDKESVEYDLNALKSANASYSGTHYGTPLQCDEKLAEFNKIIGNYQKMLPIYNGPLARMTVTGSEYSEKNLKEAERLYNGLAKLIDNTFTELKAIDISKKNYCPALNDEYEKWLNEDSGLLYAAKKTLKSYYAALEIQLMNYANKNDLDDTDSEMVAGKEILNNIDQSLSELDNTFEEWVTYVGTIDFGTSITGAEKTCEGLLGPNLLDDISLVLTWIRIVVPIMVIILGSVDFSRAVLSDDQQELKKAGSRFVKRCIVAIAIFFIPSIIMYLLSFIDKINDVSCDIRLW